MTPLSTGLPISKFLFQTYGDLVFVPADGEDLLRRVAPAHLDITANRHHDDGMRTTLTLDPDVAEALKEQVGLLNKPFKEVVNDLLRRGMALDVDVERIREPFRVNPHRGGFRPGIDLLKLNQLADELDVEDFVSDPLNGGPG